MASKGESLPSASPAQLHQGFGARSEAALGRDWRAGWLFFLPTFVLLFGLIAWPFVQGIYISFTRTIGTVADIGPFVGLQNYIDLLTDSAFWDAFWLTVRFTFLTELFKPTLGVIAALLIHNLVRWRPIVAALILLPWIVPAIVQALIWRAMFNPIFGALNAMLSMVGLPEQVWLGDPASAVWCIVMVNVWAGIPFFTVTNLAGLKSIDPELYDAAAVDGASAWQRFRYITLPGLQYTLTISILLSTIFTMNSYGSIYLLTSGGPLAATRVLGILTYERGFNAKDFGSGAAIALITLPLFAIVIWFLASYMMAGVRGTSADTRAMRTLRPLMTPFRMVFTGLFDAGEWVARQISGGLRRLLGRRQGEATASARTGRIAIGIITWVTLGALLLFELFPFYFGVVSAFKTNAQIMSVNNILWPNPWTLDQFYSLFDETKFTTWFQNTVWVAIVASVIGVVAATAGAYALVRLRWRGAAVFSTLMLISYMMPGIVMLIPLYQMAVLAGLQNTLTALMLIYPSFLLPFAIWLLMGYYKSIPEELEDAARIDGANRFQIFWKIILPLARPAIMAVLLFSITNAWNEFFLAYIILTSTRNFTFSVGLYQIVYADVYPLGQMMAATILMSIPILIFYGMAQKAMTEGLTVGGVKG
ncbi:MAG: ABC transporter permease subunit [Chloroflexi bacterium]|nr:ABC transporter permease subunit [Chloroflexota bacterium]